MFLLHSSGQSGRKYSIVLQNCSSCKHVFLTCLVLPFIFWKTIAVSFDQIYCYWLEEYSLVKKPHDWVLDVYMPLFMRTHPSHRWNNRCQIGKFALPVALSPLLWSSFLLLKLKNQNFHMLPIKVKWNLLFAFSHRAIMWSNTWMFMRSSMLTAGCYHCPLCWVHLCCLLCVIFATQNPSLPFTTWDRHHTFVLLVAVLFSSLL